MRKLTLSTGILPCLLLLALGLALVLYPSCGEKKQPAPQSKTEAYDLSGEWRSDLRSSGRTIATSVYRITQTADSLVIELVSTKSPSGDELVPLGMWFEAKGAWQDDALRLDALSWVSGKDTCTFQVRGDVDKEGRLLLHFPGDLCGGRSLPYTRALYQPETGTE